MFGRFFIAAIGDLGGSLRRNENCDRIDEIRYFFTIHIKTDHILDFFLAVQYNNKKKTENKIERFLILLVRIGIIFRLNE